MFKKKNKKKTKKKLQKIIHKNIQKKSQIDEKKKINTVLKKEQPNMNLDTIIQDLDIETDPVESDTVESDNANWVDKQNSLNIPQHISNISEIEQNSVLSEEQYNSKIGRAHV